MKRIVRSKRKSKNEQGITLLALVITIIIIIILATVAISFVFGENGLITKAQQAKLQHEIETARETLTMILGDAFVEKKINPEYDQNEFLDEFIKEREPYVYLEGAAIGLDGHVFGLDRSVPEIGEYQGEQKGPRIKEIKVTSETTNSASIEVVALNTDDATYEYWYKGNAEGEDQWKKVETDNKSNMCTISGLTQGEIYNVRVTITTKDGSATGETNVYLGEIPERAVTFTSPEWVGDGTAKTTINTSETGYTLQYQVVVGNAEPVDTAWQPATSGQQIEGLHHNETAYGRLFDGTNESKVYASVSVKDETLPTISNVELTSTENSITVTVTAQDNESGIENYTYTINGGSQTSNTTGTHTFTGLNSSTKYTISVTVTDKANNPTTEGNKTIQTKEAPSIPETTSYVGYYADIDGNGSVDGIIYADLAFSKNGYWGNSNGTYSYTNPGNLKRYKVEGTHSADGFGSKGIVKPNGGSGNERFYVMALDDVDSSYHCWYADAYGKMSDSATYTSVEFGTGEQNTSKMITKWNANGYGSKNTGSYTDIWGLTAVQNGTWNGSSGWYVPSKAEWAAFGHAFNINSSNYSDYDLSDPYWSSSQNDKYYAWYAYLYTGSMYWSGNVSNNNYYVRLGTTF